MRLLNVQYDAPESTFASATPIGLVALCSVLHLCYVHFNGRTHAHDNGGNLTGRILPAAPMDALSIIQLNILRRDSAFSAISSDSMVDVDRAVVGSQWTNVVRVFINSTLTGACTRHRGLQAQEDGDIQG